MNKELIALLDGTEVGRIRAAQNRLTFSYSDSWREAPDAYPLSLSMPLTAKEHGPSAIEPFLWGLLPDNEFVIDRWAKKYQVSARNVFALLSHVGEDCAGAVQFVTPERSETLQSGEHDKVEWLDIRQIAERLRLLREDHAAWRLPGDTGQFSLAGAQPKTALLFENGKWGIPSGRMPTTHILKPPTGQFAGHAENEHICLALSRALGLPTASSRVRRFDDEIAIVVERYDRLRQGNRIMRVHQEDACQALGIPPTRKYQNEGGPGTARIAELLRTSSSEWAADLRAFVGVVGFNWLIAGTDAHAKNYSILIGSGPRIRLAPFYDIASILPYKEFDIRKLKLAMKIGGVYELHAIGLRQWIKWANEVRTDPDTLLSELRNMARRLPDEIQTIRKGSEDEGLDNKIVDRLSQRLSERAKECDKLLSYDS